MLSARAISRVLYLGFFLLGVGLAMPGRAETQPSETALLGDFDHVSWTLKEGAPSGIWAIGQGRDGWLWLGTPSGLFRFDGVTFERHDLLPIGSRHSRSILGVYPMESGDLWVTYSAGGASVLPANPATPPITPGGLPEGIPVEQVFADANGRAIATTGNGIFFFENGKWMEDTGSRSGLPSVPIMAVKDVGNGVWAVSERDLYHMDRGSPRFRHVSRLKESGNIIGGPNGEVWQFQGKAIVRLIEGDLTAKTRTGAKTAESSIAVIDTSGTLWAVACANAGVCRVRLPLGAAQKTAKDMLSRDEYDERQGLSGMSMTVLRDREGTIWVGTKNGLDRFRSRELTVVRFKEPALYFAMAPDSNGGLWLGTASMGFRDLWRHLREGREEFFPGFRADVSAVYKDRDGGVLLGGTGGLWRFEGNRLIPIEVEKKLQGSRLQAMTRDGLGRLWVGFRNFPVYHLDGSSWRAKGGIEDLPDSPLSTAVTDSTGRAWFGYSSNLLVALEKDLVTRFGENEGLATGTVTAIFPDGDHVLIGGEQGLATLAGKRIESLHISRPESLKGITGLIRSRDGALWINGSSGALRIDAAELERAYKDPSHKMAFRLFDTGDGMPGGAQQGRPLPSVAQTSDGRLWFAATNGLAWLDPTALTRNPQPPTLAIRSLVAGKQAYPVIGTPLLPPDAREVEIGYSALDLAMPEKITFRYRLLGYSKAWEYAGSRREAFFTNLEPGHYRFELEAANEDGIWTTTSTSLLFDLEPRFYETFLFKLACAALGIALLWTAYRFRIRQSRRQLRRQIETRHAERERIARDLHDTLLQGIQGLLLNLQTWVSDESLTQRHRGDMATAAANAHEMLVEGRDRIIELRRSDANRIHLPGVLRALGEDYAKQHPAAFEFSMSGDERAIAPEAVQEIIDIARESLRNAFSHAQATVVKLHLSFGRAGPTITIVDDGIGLDALMASEGRPGHWGIPGMRERANRLKGEIRFQPAQPSGTQVRLKVPAVIAYERKRQTARK